MDKKISSLELISGAGVLLGVYALFMVIVRGHGATTHTSSMAPWGLQIVAYVYLVLISTGCTFVNFFGHIFFKEQYKPIATRVVFLALLTVLGGLGALVTEIGKPWRILNFIFSPNLYSPMWGIVFFYGIYCIFIVLEYIDLRKSKNSQWIQWGAFLSAITTHITLGSIFAITEARPYYFGALTAIYFLIVAFLTGCGLVLLTAALLKEAVPELGTAVEPIRKFIMTGLGLALLVGAWRVIIGSRASAEGYEIFLLTAPKFLILGILFGIVLPFYLAYTKKISNLLAASLIVLITQFISRYDFVVDGFLIPVFKGIGDPVFVHYSPASNEVFIALAAACFVVFFYAVAERKGVLKPAHAAKGE